MKNIVKSPVPIAAIVVISFVPSVFAQEDPIKQDPAVKPAVTADGPQYCSLSKIIGAKVRMNPGAEAKREAEKDGDTAKRPEGKIDDVLVDGTDGSLQYAVVSFGGFIGIGDKTVAVPCSALTWNEAHERFELAASEDRLNALPAFDLGKARKHGLDDTAQTLHTQWPNTAVADTTTPDKRVTGEPKDASARKAEVKAEAKALAGTPFYLVPTRFVCATEIDDHPVYAGGEKFGKINDLLIDRSGRNIALAVVKRGGALGLGGTEYLVPYRAMHFCTSGEERVHCLNVDTRKLETAVVYEKPKHGIVEAEAARRALENKTFDKSDHVKVEQGR